MSDPASATPVAPVRLVPARLGRWGRCTLALTAVGLAVPLALAGWLKPDQRGYGTHEQLGLPPCTLLRLTGVRCPSCGMTTSFAYAVRGRLVMATATNAAGAVAAVASLLMIPWCLASAAVGRTLWIRSPERAVVYAVVVLVAASFVDWAFRFLFLGGQR